MFCKHCGSQLPDDSKFCTKCGANTGVTDNYFAQQPYNTYNAQPQAPQQQAPANNGQAEETNVCAILGLIFAFFFPIIGLIFSVIGMKKQQYHSLAVAGLVISILAIVIYVIAIIVLVSAAASVAPNYPHYYY